MAEYCRNCAVEMEGEKIARKYFKGHCKPGETYLELCEGCGDYVEIDHNGWRVGTRRALEDTNQKDNRGFCSRLLALLGRKGDAA